MLFKKTRLDKYDADKSMFEIDTTKPQTETDFPVVVDYALWLWIAAAILAFIHRI